MTKPDKKTDYKPASGKDKAIIARCAKAREEAYTADSDNRKKMLDDLKFCNLDQWPEEIRNERNGRIMLTLDKVNQGVNAVIGEMRDSRPAIKVLPADSDADVETAEVFSGLIRTIEQLSSATSVYLRAGAMQVRCGYGVWRVMNEYASHDVFEQDLFVRYEKNPFNWFFDPRAKQQTKSDGRYVVGLAQQHKDDFKLEFPEVEPTNIDQMFDGQGFGDWTEDEDVIYCEYYEKRPKKRTICLLSNGHTIEKDNEGDYDRIAQANGIMIVNEREVDSYEIVYQKVTGTAVFDQQVLPGKLFPVIPVYGEVITIEGDDHIRGLVRPAKDPQRLYNYSASADVEQMALQPKAPFIGTGKMFARWKHLWNRANKDNLPYLPFTPDEKMPGGMPQRSQPPVSSSGWLQRSQIATADIKAAMGVHEASIGQESNAISGKAKLIEQQSGSITSSIYMDNLSIAIEHTGRVLVEQIPTFYDTMRVIRITGEDGQEEEVEINKPYLTPDGSRIENDLTRGKYDVRTSVGPSYRTKRQQAVDALYQLAQADPRIMQVGGDILMKNLDIPYADELEDRFRKLLAMQYPGLVEEKDPEKKAVIDQQAQAAQQKQQQQEQIQQQMLIAQIKELLAGVEKTKSEAEKNYTQADLNQAKSAAEVRGMSAENIKLITDLLAGISASPTP